MTFQLKRVEPLRAANIGALVYGVFLGFVALIVLPFLLLFSMFATTQDGVAGIVGVGFILIIYPIMGLVMGWLSGLLMSVIYNFVVPWTGCLLLELDAPAAASL